MHDLISYSIFMSIFFRTKCATFSRVIFYQCKVHEWAVILFLVWTQNRKQDPPPVATAGTDFLLLLQRFWVLSDSHLPAVLQRQDVSWEYFWIQLYSWWIMTTEQHRFVDRIRYSQSLHHFRTIYNTHPASTMAELDSMLNSGDTAWMLTATALVLLMTMPGLAIYYSGMVRDKNVLACKSSS